MKKTDKTINNTESEKPNPTDTKKEKNLFNKAKIAQLCHKIKAFCLSGTCPITSSETDPSKKPTHILCCVSRALAPFAIFLAVIYIFNDAFETVFAPSAQHIPALRNEIEHLNKQLTDSAHQIAEQSRQLADLKATNQKDIASLKTDYAKILAELKTLESRSSAMETQITASTVASAIADNQTDKDTKAPISLAQTIASAIQNADGQMELLPMFEPFKDIESSWQSLQTRIAKGEPFVNEIKALQRFITDDANIAHILQGLSEHAKTPMKTFEQLSNELAVVKAQLIFNASDRNQSWWMEIWAKVKALIHIESEAQKAVDANTPAQKSDLVTAIDTAIGLIAESKYREAVDAVQKLNDTQKAVVDKWVQHAENRIVVHDRLEHLKALIASYLPKKAA